MWSYLVAQTSSPSSSAFSLNTTLSASELSGGTRWVFGTAERIRESRSFRASAKWKWWGRDKDSSLDGGDALPLPMTYPGSKPLSAEELDNAANCDAEKEDCRTIPAQWTGKCRRCGGTGLVDFYRKRGRKVISKCAMCFGIGYVHKITSRTSVEIENVDDDNAK